MNKKAAAGLVLAWGALIYISENLCEHAIYEWILQILSTWLSEYRAQIVSMIMATSIPVVVSAFIVIFAFYWGHYIAQQKLQPSPSYSSNIP